MDTVGQVQTGRVGVHLVGPVEAKMVARPRRGRNGLAAVIAVAFGLQLMDSTVDDQFDALGVGCPDAEAAFIVLVGGAGAEGAVGEGGG